MGDEDEWQSATRRRPQQQRTNPPPSSSSTFNQSSHAARPYQGGYGQGPPQSTSSYRGAPARGGFSSRGRARPIEFLNIPLEFNKPYKIHQQKDFGWNELPPIVEQISLPRRPTQPATICESEVKIVANFFRTNISLPEKIYHYQLFFNRLDGGGGGDDVSQKLKDMNLEELQNETGGGGDGPEIGEKKKDKKKQRFPPDIRTNLANYLVKHLEENHRKQNNTNQILGVITDFSDALYSCAELPSNMLDWQIKGGDLGEESDSSVVYEAHIRLTQEKIDIAAVKKMINSMKGLTVEQPLIDIERVYNVLVRCFNTEKYTPIGRSALVEFKELKGNEGNTDPAAYPLTKGLVSYKGYNVIQCLSNGWTPYLNVDIANNACVPNTTLMNYLSLIFSNDKYRASEEHCGNIQKWTEGQFREANLKVKGIKVIYRIIDADQQTPTSRNQDNVKTLGGTIAEVLKTTVSTTSFEYDNGDGSNSRKISVKEYFEEKYLDRNGRKLKLKFPNGPCLSLKGKKNRMIPGELCKIVKGQSFNQKLDDVQTSKMIDVSRKNPDQLYPDIIKVHGDLNLGNNPLAKRYGVEVERQMLTLNRTRVLPAPQIIYGKKVGSTNPNLRAVAHPTNGVWDGWNSQGDFEFFEPKQVKKWGVLDLAGCPPNETQHFSQRLTSKAQLRNLTLPRTNDSFFINKISLPSKDLNDATRKLVEEMGTWKKKNVDFLLVIIPSKNAQEYTLVKQVAELNVGILTQCVARRNIEQSNRTESILGNLLVKIHSKIGGVNHVVQAPEKYRKEFDVFTEQPVMILGADVTHPSQSASVQQQPSLAAVTCSISREGMKFVMTCEAQIKADKEAAEVILNLQGIMENFFKLYRSKNHGLLPVKILYYRDGVGSGQFKEVLHKEMRAIRHACTQLEKDLKLNYSYQPRITFVVVQKRNKARFFLDQNDKKVNVNAGTIIDSEITHPTDHDFFMIPHQGILGTSRPTRCIVLWDDSKLSMDKLQLLTYYMCYMYVRCNRAVRIPAPTYYAHWAAARAKILCEWKPRMQNEEIDTYINRLNGHLRMRENFAEFFPMHFI